MKRYHEALCAEMMLWVKQCGPFRIKRIFIGGGTPSTYPDALLLDMSGKLRDILDVSLLEEATIEVNPGTVRLEQLELWREIGINRLSIGVQTLQDWQLHALNRYHTTNDVYFLLDHAKNSFENISVDLMLGLPGMSTQQWKEDLVEVVTWSIKHISLYCLMIHENTPLYFKIQKGELTLPKDDSIAKLYEWSVAFLQCHGFMQYEVSNFAQDGWESKHNFAYWDRQPYKGLGLSACSFDGQYRFQNENNLMRYLACLENEQDPVVFSEKLTPSAIRLEKLMLGLRRPSGVPLEMVLAGLDKEIREDLIQKIAQFKQRGLICECNNHLMLTVSGFLVENEVIAQLA